MDDFEKLCQQSKRIVYRYLLSLCHDESVAEELTSETFFQAYIHIGEFRGECRIQSWLCKIARNAYMKELKRRIRFYPLDTATGIATNENILERFCDREQASIILRLLHGLKEPYKEVFMLRVIGELSFKEIAEIFGKTESWSKVTFYRAKEKLIQRMEADYEN